MVRVERIELSIHPWEGYVLPLNHTRSSIMYTFCDFWSRRRELDPRPLLYESTALPLSYFGTLKNSDDLIILTDEDDCINS